MQAKKVSSPDLKAEGGAQTLARGLAALEIIGSSAEPISVAALSLVLVPWTETTAPPEPVINMMAEQTGTKVQHGSPSDKPHGRKCWTLQFPAFGDPRWIDISVMPRSAPKGGEHG